MIGPFPSGSLPLPPVLLLLPTHRLVPFLLALLLLPLGTPGAVLCRKTGSCVQTGRRAVPAFPWDDFSPLLAVIPRQQAKDLTDVLGRWPNIGGWGDADATYQWIFPIKLRKSNLDAVGISSFLECQEPPKNMY